MIDAHQSVTGVLVTILNILLWSLPTTIHIEANTLESVAPVHTASSIWRNEHISAVPQIQYLEKLNCFLFCSSLVHFLKKWTMFCWGQCYHIHLHKPSQYALICALTFIKQWLSLKIISVFGSILCHKTANRTLVNNGHIQENTNATAWLTARSLGRNIIHVICS